MKSQGRAIRLNILATILLLAALVAGSGCAPKRVVGGGVVTTSSEATTSEPSSQPAQVSGNADHAARGDETLAGFTPLLPEPRVLGRAGVFEFDPVKKPPSGANRPEGSRLGFEAAALAKKQLGKQYQWGASGPDKFDCSGLVMYVYDNLGVALPRVSSQQAYAGVHVERNELQPGDLVFFVLSGSTINHVGIYVGGSKFVHAPRRYSPVRVDSLNDSWWRHRYRGARRIQ